jgi:hypothetical protein
MTEPQTHATSVHTMQCMEVWGGNQAVDNGVIMPGLDAWVYSRPHDGDAAGGDVHYLSSCATGRITRLMVADVSGHGQTVSETAVALRGLMRRFINHLDQQKAVEFLNREFGKLEKSGRFATAILGTFWAPTGQLTLCNAGHPRPFWYRAKDNAWHLIRAREEEGDGPVDVPLGVLDSTTYSQLGVRLRASDMVLLYTDSLTEARTAGGELLGEAGAQGLLNRVDAREPAAFVRSLLSRFESEGVTFSDDVTLLLLRANGLVPPLSFRERLNAIGHVLGELIPGRGGAKLPEMSVANTGGFFFKRLNAFWSFGKK